MGAGAGCGAGGGVSITGGGAGVGAATTSGGGVIPGSGISTSGRSRDVVDEGVVSTALVIRRSSGEFEIVVTAAGCGMGTSFGPPISGVLLSCGARLRISS